MPFLQKKKFNDIGILISIVILITSSLYGLYKKDDITFVVLVLFPALCGLLLFIWWKIQLTRTYKDILYDNEIKELESTIEKLKQDNETLSKLVHKDNKLIPAMELAVRELMETCLTATAQNVITSKTHTLLEALDTLSNERKGILRIQELQPSTMTETGNTRLDTLLRYMRAKAISHEIIFDFVRNANLKHLLETTIDEDSLCTIIADLIDNAIIATKKQQTKHVLFCIDIENQHYCLNFYDSGIPFEAETILNIGKIRITTHAASGGSGIGLMNTFELLKSVSASFIIDETIPSTNFTKKVSICFDACSEFRIISNRAAITSICSKRENIILKSL